MGVGDLGVGIVTCTQRHAICRHVDLHGKNDSSIQEPGSATHIDAGQQT